MTADPHAQTAEIIELQTRVAELSVALERVTEQRDNALDTAHSLHKELESTLVQLKDWKSTVDRLRLHIQQGVEL